MLKLAHLFTFPSFSSPRKLFEDHVPKKLSIFDDTFQNLYAAISINRFDYLFFATHAAEKFTSHRMKVN